MSERPEFVGCGAPASLVVYRGRTRRLFTCDACLDNYQGSGRAMPYATDTTGVEKQAGTHYGAEKKCGDRVDE